MRGTVGNENEEARNLIRLVLQSYRKCQNRKGKREGRGQVCEGCEKTEKRKDRRKKVGVTEDDSPRSFENEF